MEMTLCSNFCEMTQEEELLIDGGSWKHAVVAGIGIVAIGCAPALGVGAVVVAGKTVAYGVGLALTVAGSGSLAVGAASH